MVCLASQACNRQSSETALTFLKGVIDREVLGRLGKKFLLTQPRSQALAFKTAQLTGVVFNQLSVVKSKLKLSLSPIAEADTDNPMKSINQSKLVVNTCSQRRAREKVCTRVAIGFGLTYDWLKKWREFFLSQCLTQNQFIFDTRAKTRHKLLNSKPH